MTQSSFSRLFLDLIDELVQCNCVSKDHASLDQLRMEEKYELIRLESKGALKINNGMIQATPTLKNCFS